MNKKGGADIYLDNAATSYPKPERVYQAIDNYLRQVGVSPGRGTYQRALKAEEMFIKTRQLLAELFNIEQKEQIVFTANVTEALNLALKGFLKKGDHVITSQLEHNSMWRPLKVLEKKGIIELTVLPCPAAKPFNKEELEKAIRSNTKLVALNHASNVTGTILPIKMAGSVCHEHQISLLIDAAQTAGLYPINVQELHIDLLAFTGHKGLLGPTGTGGLYINPELNLTPLKEGGTGRNSLLEYQPDYLPERFEAGTQNVVGIIGLGAGVEFILEKGIENIWEYEVELKNYALKILTKIPEIEVYGPTQEKRVGVIPFNIKGFSPQDVAHVLDEVYGIMLRAGLHCAPQAHRCIGTIKQGTVRLSLGYFNTKEELDQLAQALIEIASS